VTEALAESTACVLDGVPFGQPTQESAGKRELRPTTVVAEKTIERTTAVTVATPTTIYYRETEWGTTAGLSVVLLIADIVLEAYNKEEVMLS
jgi:hypothetical protein